MGRWLSTLYGHQHSYPHSMWPIVDAINLTRVYRLRKMHDRKLEWIRDYYHQVPVDVVPGSL